MATIAGVTVTFSLPENDSRVQKRSTGQASDGSFKFLSFGNSERRFVIQLNGLTTAIKDSLIAALEADADGNVSIDPDSHVNLGGGDGVAVNAQWVDTETNFTKINHDFWTGSLTFIKTT